MLRDPWKKKVCWIKQLNISHRFSYRTHFNKQVCPKREFSPIGWSYCGRTLNRYRVCWKLWYAHASPLFTKNFTWCSSKRTAVLLQNCKNTFFPPHWPRRSPRCERSTGHRRRNAEMFTQWNPCMWNTVIHNCDCICSVCSETGLLLLHASHSYSLNILFVKSADVFLSLKL